MGYSSTSTIERSGIFSSLPTKIIGGLGVVLLSTACNASSSQPSTTPRNTATVPTGDCMQNDPQGKYLTPELRAKICKQRQKATENMPQLWLRWGGEASLEMSSIKGRQLGKLSVANTEALHTIYAEISKNPNNYDEDQSAIEFLGLSFVHVDKSTAGNDCYSMNMSGLMMPVPGKTLPQATCAAAWSLVINDPSKIFDQARDLGPAKA